MQPKGTVDKSGVIRTSRKSSTIATRDTGSRKRSSATRKVESELDRLQQQERVKQLKARDRWNFLRVKVKLGTYKLAVRLVQNEENVLTLIDKTWRKIHESVGVTGLSILADSTDSFSGEDWMIQKTGRSHSDTFAVSRGLARASIAAESSGSNMKLNSQVTSKGDKNVRRLNTTFFNSIKSINLARVPQLNMDKLLLTFANWIRINHQNADLDHLDFGSLQLNLNRCWKMFLLGLHQPEPISRYVSMVCINRLASIMRHTLVDVSILITLLDIAVGDELDENQTKANYLLAEIAMALKDAKEYDFSLTIIFKQLAKSLLDRQYRQKVLQALNSENLSTIIQRFHTVGKFASLRRKNDNNPSFIQDIILYLVHEELSLVQKFMSVKDKEDHSAPPSHIYLCVTLIDILCNDIEYNDKTKKFMGAMFKDYIYPWIQSPLAQLQRAAVQFASKWMPIESENATIYALDQLIVGLEQTKLIEITESFDKIRYQQEYEYLCNCKYNEQCDVALRSKLVRQILQTPGTVSNLLPIPGCPGFFCEAESSLRFSKSILIDLPVHPDSNITITAVIPAIPGVPKGVTTAPPLFVENFRLIPDPESQYQLEELTGKIPNLPSGYTYTPNVLAPGKNIVFDKEDGAIVVTASKPWKDDDLIIESEELKSPPELATGFTSQCPYNGFDPTLVDKSAHSTSAIYDRSSSSKEEAGFSRVAYPVLFSPKTPLKNKTAVCDFPVNSTIIIDIIDPQAHRLKRVKAIIRSYDSPLSDVTIHHDTSLYNICNSSEDFIHIGTILSFYVRPRADESRWICVKCEVVDDEYNDDVNPLSLQKQVAKKGRNEYETFDHPVPSAYTRNNEPLFSPYVCLTPIPAFYNEQGTPYYGQTPTLKQAPTILTKKGQRLYSVSNEAPHIKNMLAGYDYNGQPFFVPKYYTITEPTGFSIDGIPFYDAASIIFHPGYLITPKMFNVKSEDEEEYWESLIYRWHYEKVPAKIQKRLEKLFLGRLGKTLKGTQPKIMNLLFNSSRRSHKSFQSQGMMKKWAPMILRKVQDPIDILRFLRQGMSGRAERMDGFKIIIEPTSYEFYSFRTAQTKTIALRYRAPRGDRAVRELFVAVEPRHIFSTTDRCLRLSGEDVVQISVTFSPLKMESDLLKGGLHIIDGTGMKIASCQLIALRQGFFSISPSILNTGWLLPEKRKNISLKITNHSSNAINLTVALKSDEITDQEKAKDIPFKIKQRSIRILPFECKPLSIAFEPKFSGNFHDSVVVIGPGGDMLTSKLIGHSGIPIVIYPESSSSSALGSSVLTKERSLFVTKYRKLNEGDIELSSFGFEELKIIKSMNDAELSAKMRKDAHTLDFGICSPESKEVERCITFMNLGESPIIISLYCHDRPIKCVYLVRIPPYSANSIAVQLCINDGDDKLRGNFTGLIEVAYPEFENLPIYLSAYVGQPAFFPVWENVFFKPCRIGEKQEISLSLCNESQYEIYVNSPNDESSLGEIRDTLPNENHQPLQLPPFGLVPITFTFAPEKSGVFKKKIVLSITKPFCAKIPSGMMGRNIQIFGICIDPNRNPKNAISAIGKWIGNVAALRDDNLIPSNLDVFTDSKHPAVFDIAFKTDPFISENTAFSLASESTSSSLIVQNRGNTTKDISFMGSSCFSISPNRRPIHPGEMVKLDHFFSAPFDILKTVTIYGFIMAFEESTGMFSSTQIIKKMSSGLLVLPYIGGDEKQIIIDFGIVELAGDLHSDAVKYLMLCNPHTTSFKWSIKNTGIQTQAFEFPITSGDVPSYETFTIPIKFCSKVSGNFETSVEISVFDVQDLSAKPIAKVQVSIRGTAIYTALSGMPESIDFSNTLINSTQNRSIFLTNAGTSELMIKAFAKPPFSVKPGNAILGPKENLKVEIGFSPKQNVVCNSKIQIFANQTMHIINVSGCGGMSSMEFEKYGSQILDFGICKESTISWTSVYVCNSGTLSSIVVGLSSSNAKLIKLKFVETVSTVPLHYYQTKDDELKDVRNDYWNVLRRKLRVFKYYKPFLTGERKFLKDYDDNTDEKCVISGLDISISQQEQLVYKKEGISGIPVLKPCHSYHFKVGYIATDKEATDTDLVISYIPDIQEDENTQLHHILKTCALDISGKVVRPLEIIPKSIDFGNCPAERFLVAGDSGIPKKGNQKDLLIINLSKTSQELSLTQISEPFSLEERFWTIPAGEQLTLPLNFQPHREQFMYKGLAQFQHDFGSDTIQLSGVGATAELMCVDRLDFGRLKIGSKAVQKFEIQNGGVLPLQFELDIIQNKRVFKILGQDPYESQGCLESGLIFALDIECDCKFKSTTGCAIQITWKKIPMGQTQKTVIPLIVDVGYPIFSINLIEFDFKTTYIDVNKTIPFKMMNTGNAMCNWEIQCENQAMTCNLSKGLIGPGDEISAELTYTPRQYESHSSVINFITDATVLSVGCIGVVGVPYLKVPRELLNADFGIITIDRIHSKTFEISNTGKQVIEFEILWTQMAKGGADIPSDEFDIFSITPNHGSIKPGTALMLTLSTKPKEYGVFCVGKFLIRTKDGEQYKGSVTSVGGMAIIKIKPPTKVSTRVQALNVASSDNDFNINSSGGTKNYTNLPVVQAETNRYLMQAHMDNLYDVLAGIRVMETTAEKISVDAQNAIATLPPKSHPPTPPNNMNTMRSTPMRRGSKVSLPKEEIKPETPSTLEHPVPKDTVPDTDRVFDGSDIRIKSRVGTPSSSRPDSNHSSNQEMQSAAYMDELLKLEKELEIAIGIRNINSPLISEKSTPPSQSIMGEIGLKYNAGRKKGLKKKSNAPILDSGTVSPTMSQLFKSKSKLPGIDSNNESFAEELEPSDIVENEVGSHSVEKLAHEPDESSKPPTYPTEKQSSRISTPKLPSQRPLSRKEEHLANSLFQKGLLVPEAVMSAADLKNSRTIIENILSLTKDISETIGQPLDDKTKKEVLNVLNDRVLDGTKAVLKIARQQMKQNAWLQNRDFITQALKRLQMSTLAIQAMLEPSTDQHTLDANTFDLGVIKGGDLTPLILLFNVPNEGNITFDFKIVKDSNAFSKPQGCEEILGGEFFKIDPEDGGHLDPGKNVNVSASFQAISTGYYRQKYIVKSGDEEILTFTVMCQVGNPDLRLLPPCLDFGLIEKGKPKSKALVLTNVGTYKDTWRLELTNEDSEIDGPFSVVISEGEIAAKESLSIPVVFEPRDEGSYKTNLKLIWTGEALHSDLIGIGGGAKLQYIFLHALDKAFNGMDFGICIVGVQYHKTFKLRNIGNVDGVIELAHPNPNLSFNLPRNSIGECRIPPNSEVDIEVHFNPGRSELIREPISIRLGTSNTQLVNFKAKCGIQEWSCTGDLDFLNMQINENQSKIISVKNTGTLDITFDIAMAENISQYVNFICLEEWQKGRSLRPNQAISFEVFVTSDHDVRIDGDIKMITNLCGVDTIRQFPIKLHIYEKEVALDHSEDVGVGRVLVGESISKQWNIENFGNRRVQYRAKLHSINGSVLQNEGWKIKSVDEGFIESGSKVLLEVTFESLPGKGHEWQEAILVIEKLEEDGKWGILNTIKLQGAAGEPQFELYPTDIDFGSVGLDVEAISYFVIKNAGDAMLKYEILKTWESNEDFYFKDDEILKGYVDAENEKRFNFIFKSSRPGRQTTTVTVVSSIGEKAVNFFAEAAPYQIYIDHLPPVLDFGTVLLGDVMKISIDIQNDCPHVHTLYCKIYDEDPRESSALVSEVLSVSPTQFLLKGVTDYNERPSFTLDISPCIFIAEDKNIDDETLNRYQLNQLKRGYLHICSEQGISEVIPVEITFEVEPIIVSFNNEQKDKISFGECSTDTGGKKVVQLVNYNTFPVQLNVEIEDPSKFGVNLQSVVLSPKSKTDFEFELFSLDITSDNVIPKIQHLSSNVAFKINLQKIPDINVILEGYLVDTVPKLSVASSLSFGCVFTSRSETKQFIISNPTRRKMRARLNVDRNYQDIFRIQEQIPAFLPPKTTLNLNIAFSPQIAASYNAQATLEGEAGNTVITLSGEGVDPKLYCSTQKIDFGLVGVGRGEYRKLTVSNLSKIKHWIRISCPNKSFKVIPCEILLEPSIERQIRIEFYPRTKNEQEFGIIAICMIEDLDDGLSEREEYSVSDELSDLQKVEVKGIGGTFGITASGISLSDLENEIVLSASKADVLQQKTTILLEFPRLNLRGKLSKSFIIENTGNVPLDLIVLDNEKQNIGAGFQKTSKGHISWQVNPSTISIPSNSSETINVMVSGVTIGKEDISFTLVTKKLVDEVKFHIKLTAEVVDGLDESFKAFVRADQNIETILNLAQQEEDLVATDKNLWKLMLPIVRISYKLPSEELKIVPAAEPNVAKSDISPLLVRPPAIPVVLIPKNKKWYINRVSMGLDKGPASDELEEFRNASKKQEAVQFIAPVERLLYLETKRAI